MLAHPKNRSDIEKYPEKINLNLLFEKLVIFKLLERFLYFLE